MNDETGNNQTGAGDGDMHIRRFVAETSRAALRQVREALGGDAIILANRSVDGGVEVLAAAPEAVEALTRGIPATRPASLPPATPTELGLPVATVGRKRLASLFSRRTQAKAATPTFAEQTSSARRAVAAKGIGSHASFADRLAAASQDDEDFVMRLAPQTAASSRPVAASKPNEGVTAPSETPILAADLSIVVGREVHREAGDVPREIRAVQAMSSEQRSTFTRTDAMRGQPVRAKLMEDLIAAGFSPSLARRVRQLLPDGDDDAARAWVESILRRNLSVASDADESIAEGGVFALVGPTGVGKTTTVAKLAARFAMKHGVDRLALIATDGFRIGAEDQLRIYGRMLGVAVHSIHDGASLTRAVEHLKDRTLVLIDTAGMSQRDGRVAEQLAMLRGAKAKRLVVLDAAADAETLDHVVATFADREFAGCVITKTDEAARLGPVLDAVIRHRLCIHHVSTGRKVPEDLERPDAGALVSRALERRVARAAFDGRLDGEPVLVAATAGPPTVDDGEAGRG